MTDLIVAGISALAQTKFTVAQTQANCPARLQATGQEIRERCEEAQKQQAEDHMLVIESATVGYEATGPVRRRSGGTT